MSNLDDKYAATKLSFRGLGFPGERHVKTYGLARDIYTVVHNDVRVFIWMTGGGSANSKQYTIEMHPGSVEGTRAGWVLAGMVRFVSSDIDPLIIACLVDEYTKEFNRTWRG